MREMLRITRPTYSRQVPFWFTVDSYIYEVIRIDNYNWYYNFIHCINDWDKERDMYFGIQSWKDFFEHYSPTYLTREEAYDLSPDKYFLPCTNS